MSSQSNSPSINVTSPSASSTISSSSFDAKIGNNFHNNNNNNTTNNNKVESNNSFNLHSSNSNIKDVASTVKGQNVNCSSTELQSSLHLNSNWATSADSLSEKSTVKRDSTCDKCKNHHQVKQIKDHKINCPYKDCNCGRCLFTVIRRRVTSANQRKRRQKLSANEKDIFDHERIYERLRVLDLLTWDLDIMIKEPSKGYCKIDDDDILNLWSILKKYLIQGVTLIKAKKVDLTDSNLINHHISNGHNNNSNSENFNCNLTTSTLANSNCISSPSPGSSSSPPTNSSANCLNSKSDHLTHDGKLQNQQPTKSSSSHHHLHHQPHQFDQATCSTSGETYNGFKLTPKMQCKSNLKVHLTSMKSPEGRPVEQPGNESIFSAKQSIFCESGLPTESTELNDQSADGGKMIKQRSLESPLTVSKSIRSQFKCANSPSSPSSSSFVVNNNYTSGGKGEISNLHSSTNDDADGGDFKIHSQFDEQINSTSSGPSTAADHKPGESQYGLDESQNVSSSIDSSNSPSVTVNTQVNNDSINFNHSLNSPFESIPFGHFKLTPGTFIDFGKVSHDNSISTGQTSGPPIYSPSVSNCSDLFSSFANPIFNSFNRTACSIRPVIAPKPFLPPSLAQQIYNHHHHHHPHHPHGSNGTYFSPANYHSPNHQSNVFGHPNINHRIHPYAYHPYTSTYHSYSNSLSHHQITHNNLISDSTRTFNSSSTSSPSTSSTSSLVNNPFLPDSLKPSYLREASSVSSPMQPISADDLRYNRSLIVPEKCPAPPTECTVSPSTSTSTTSTATTASIDTLNNNSNNLLANYSSKSNEQTDHLTSQSTSSSPSSSSAKSENHSNKFTATYSKYDEATVINSNKLNSNSNTCQINKSTSPSFIDA